MNTHRFILELEFSGDISSNTDITDIMINIKNALEYQANKSNIVPEDSDHFTKRISVISEDLDAKVEIKFM